MMDKNFDLYMLFHARAAPECDRTHVAITFCLVYWFGCSLKAEMRGLRTSADSERVVKMMIETVDIER